MKSMKKSRDLETHENENTMTQSIWDITKAVQYIYIYIPCIYMKAYLNKLKQSKLTPKGIKARHQFWLSYIMTQLLNERNMV